MKKLRKPIVAMDISSTGKGGGPYTFTMNLINSSLKDKVDYELIEYKTELGRYISLKRIRDLVKQLKMIRPDIVHFGGLQISGFHIAVACKIAKVPKSVLVIHGSSAEALNIGKIKKKLIRYLEYATLWMVDTYYGVSEYSSKLAITNSFKQKSSGYIYNLPPLMKKSDSPARRQEFGFSDQDVIVVSVARIVKDKGYHIFKDAIKKLADLPNVKYLIIGDGSYLKTMQQELVEESVTGKVQFLGYREDVNQILPFCDIFVLPTLHETLSIALLEASKNCLPLIASNVGGIPEIIKSGENGILIPPSNPALLAKAIRELAVDDFKRKVMGEKAKELVEIKFSEEVIIRKVYNLYQKMLNE